MRSVSCCEVISRRLRAFLDLIFRHCPLQQRCADLYCSEGLLDYVLDIVDASRQGQDGLSPRASQGLVAAARAWALIAGRDHVVIDDVQAVLPSVVEHRLDAGCPSHAGTPLSVELLERVNALR